MNFNKSLSHEDVHLHVMIQNDFDRLFDVAKDPKIWEQHNDRQRCTLDGFRKYFNDAVGNTENCFLIFYKGELVGSTRYYQYSLSQSSLKIGYTFYAIKCWGTGLNRQVKNLMLDYAFKFVDNVFFDVWYKNFRSQKAVERLGAKFYTKEKSGEKYSFLLTKDDLVK